MSGEVNVIPTLREIRGGASLETFSGEGQLKKPPCMIGGTSHGTPAGVRSQSGGGLNSYSVGFAK